MPFTEQELSKVFFSRDWAFGLALGVVFSIVVLVMELRRKKTLLHRVGDASVLQRLLDPQTPRRHTIKAVWLVIAAIFWILALAGPHWGQKYQEVRRRGVDVILAMDVSKSMLAEDVLPNRLTQAKRDFRLLIDGMQGDRVGIIAFAGQALLQCPLTLDYSAARMLLDLLEPDLVPVPGTSLSSAIETATEAFESADRKHKALVLLTDGEDHSKSLPAAIKRAQDEGVRIFAIGIGNPEGEIIPLRDRDGQLKGYQQDKEGETVLTKLNEQSLREIASETNGRYYRATEGEVEVARLLEDLQSMEKKSLKDHIRDRYEDQYTWPLIFVLLFLLLEFLWPETSGHGRWLGEQIRHQSKRWRPGVLFLVVLISGSGLNAMGRSSDDGQAAAKPSQVSSADPRIQYNLGRELYREEDYKSSAQAFQNSQDQFRDPRLRARGAYNQGNALYREEQYQEALKSYKQSLKWNPEDQDAKHNLEWTQMVIDHLEKQKNENQDQNGGENQEEKSEQAPGAQRDPEEQEDDESNQQKEAEASERELTEDETERLLQAIEKQEREARKDLKHEPPDEPIDKDW